MMNILAGEETLRRSRRTGKVLLIIECCNFLQLEIVSLLTNLFSSGTSTFGSIGSSKERDFKSKAWSMVQGSELLVEDRLASKLRILTFYITAKNLFFSPPTHSAFLPLTRTRICTFLKLKKYPKFIFQVWHSAVQPEAS